MAKLKLYSVFHCNLAFSSIPETKHREVIKQCYWPLLELAERNGHGVSIEATGYTLEVIKKLDPTWIAKFKALLKKGRAEFIGSGYAQIIGPLVPAEVNARNLLIGNDVYKKILGVVPRIAFVNEHTYSPGLLSVYKKAGYEALFTEWNNPATFHPQWKREWQYMPQIVSDQQGLTLPVVWNNSITFQKFQRYVHGEIDFSEYIAYIRAQKHNSLVRHVPFYGSDAEVFDFRPGRFHTETNVHGVRQSEWEKIQHFIDEMKKEEDVEFVRLEDILSYKTKDYAPQILSLESADQPIVVKKQEKYNTTRWGVTGRDSVGINTVCYQIYENMMRAPSTARANSLWKTLCFLWDSDFRTHTEEKKFKNYKILLQKTLADSVRIAGAKKPLISTAGARRSAKQAVDIQQGPYETTISTPSVKISFLPKKGMAIQSLTFPDISKKSLIGTIPHGHYESISLSPDFYTGHTVIEMPGKQKVTDLGPAEVIVPGDYSKDPFVCIVAAIKTKVGGMSKEIRVYKHEPRVDIYYSFDFHMSPLTSFRTGMVTLNPDAFDQKKLYYACHNGGVSQDVFPLHNIDLVKDSPVSLLISSRGVLGNTTGIFEIGDNEKKISLITTMSQVAALPIVSFIKLAHENTYFKRVSYSMSEIDETALLRGDKEIPYAKEFTLSIQAAKK